MGGCGVFEIFNYFYFIFYNYSRNISYGIEADELTGEPTEGLIVRDLKTLICITAYAGPGLARPPKARRLPSAFRHRRPPAASRVPNGPWSQLPHGPGSQMARGPNGPAPIGPGTQYGPGSQMARSRMVPDPNWPNPRWHLIPIDRVPHGHWSQMASCHMARS